jgi:hypothetical protein
MYLVYNGGSIVTTFTLYIRTWLWYNAPKLLLIYLLRVYMHNIFVINVLFMCLLWCDNWELLRWSHTIGFFNQVILIDQSKSMLNKSIPHYRWVFQWSNIWSIIDHDLYPLIDQTISEILLFSHSHYIIFLVFLY